jgi:hypothetical protein
MPYSLLHLLLTLIHSKISLSDVSPLSGTVSTEVEYRDLIYVSLDIQGDRNYRKTVSAVLNSQVSMCYLNNSAMGLNVSGKNEQCSSLYGCGEFLSMDILLVGQNKINYESILLTNSAKKNEGILGINFFIQDPSKFPGPFSITLIPNTPSEIKFTAKNAAKYSVSKGTMSNDILTKEKHCLGRISNFPVMLRKSESKSSLAFKATLSLIRARHQKVKVQDAVIYWDTSIAQTEYSSAILDHLNFEELEIHDSKNIVVAKLDIQKIRRVENTSLFLRIGVDVIRNLAIEFNFTEQVVRVCLLRRAAGADDAQEAAVIASTSSELHGIAVNLQRETPAEFPIKILTTYDTTVVIEMIRNQQLLGIKLDTGSSWTYIPESFTYPCEKGDSSFYCEYMDGAYSTGSKMALAISFPTRQGGSLKAKTSTVIGGINKSHEVKSGDSGLIGLRYTETMDSIPYIWNVEWMVFIPEVIKEMTFEADTNHVLFPNGPGLGRLELNGELRSEDLCEEKGIVVASFSADRSTWEVQNLVLVYTTDQGKDQEYKFEKVLIDTGSTVSLMADSLVREHINKSSTGIRIKAAFASSGNRQLSALNLPREENFPFFVESNIVAGAKGVNILGINILRRLVVGFGMNSGIATGNGGQVKMCIPKSPHKKQIEISKSERDRITKEINRLKSSESLSYECQRVSGFRIFHEHLINSWKVQNRKLAPIDWKKLKSDVSVWVPWDDCFQDVLERQSKLQSRKISSLIILESIVANTRAVEASLSDDSGADEDDDNDSSDTPSRRAQLKESAGDLGDSFLDTMDSLFADSGSLLILLGVLLLVAAITVLTWFKVAQKFGIFLVYLGVFLTCLGGIISIHKNS